MVLSKSNYITFLKHPAWLWLEKHEPDRLPAVDANTQAMFDAGNLFETYAEQLFPNAVTLGYKRNGHFDYDTYNELPKRTTEALGSGVKTILQGRVEVDGITCAFDVLERNTDGTFNLFEIKSSTSAKPEHEHDLAFQMIVLERAGLQIANVYVIHVNNQYVRNGAIDPKEITDTTEVTSAVRALKDRTEVNIEKAKRIMELPEMPDPSPRYARNGAFNEWLAIYETLNGDFDTYSIYNLTTVGARRIGALEDIGVTSIVDIPDEINLTPKQHRQVIATKRGKRLIDADEIRGFLKMMEYPLYFLDYETFAGVIPAFDGLRPYQQVPFQYSLHIIPSPGAEVIHKEYLHTENSLPVTPLLRQMREDIGPHGTVLVWFQDFEKGRNAEMAELVPEFNEFLYDVNDRVIDLMTPFAEGWYVDKDFFGSASIKAVLPVLVPELSYKVLEIQEGGTAQRTWMDTVLGGNNDERREMIFDNLRKYCELDTLAMVKIWEILNKV